MSQVFPLLSLAQMFPLRDSKSGCRMWGAVVQVTVTVPAAPPAPESTFQEQSTVTASKQLCDEATHILPTLQRRKLRFQEGKWQWLDYLERALPRHEPRTILLSPVGPSLLHLLSVSLSI